MRSIKASEFEPGFVLAREVEAADGSKLLKMGTVLSHAHLALLKSWKVREIFIEDAKAPAQAAQVSEPPAAAPAQPADPVLAVARERLRKRFEGRLVNPWMQALYDEAEKRLGTPKIWH
jgi:hypothetical protein